MKGAERSYFLDCDGPASCCNCAACAVAAEHDEAAYAQWREEERNGPLVGAGERRPGLSGAPHASRPRVPLAGFHQLGDDADGEGWS